MLCKYGDEWRLKYEMIMVDQGLILNRIRSCISGCRDTADQVRKDKNKVIGIEEGEEDLGARQECQLLIKCQVCK